MKKIIIIISTLLILPSILFADSAWLLWQYWTDSLDVFKEKGKWSLINALNSRSECLDALLKEHIGFYKRYLDDPNYEVLPKPKETELRCIQRFYSMSESEFASTPCKEFLTYFVMRFDKKGINSNLTLEYTDKKYRQIREKIHQMREEGKTQEEINAYVKTEGSGGTHRASKVEFWCLPAGVDPKTIRNR